jgi:hypothetical protein
MFTSKRRRLTGLFLALGATLIVTAGVAAAGPDALDRSPSAAPMASPKVGEVAPAFTATDTRGNAHSLAAYRGRWVVLEWFNHECPFVRKHYTSVNGRPGNTQAMQRDYADRVVWLSVVSSAPGNQGYTSAAEADRLTQEKGAAPAAVIRDADGQLGRLYGAQNTPQYAIVDPQGVLRYAGAIDDRRTPAVRDIEGATNYVRAALDAGLAGRAIAVTQTQPYGCDVKY